jgi:uncharacterized membrane protein
MRLMNRMASMLFALLAGALIQSAFADSDPGNPGDTPPIPVPWPPLPYSPYTVVDMGGVIGSTDTAATAIGTAGRAVGWMRACIGRGCTPTVSAVYWDVGQPPKKIPALPGMASSRATGITDSGVIVGNSTDPGGHSHGWRWSAETGTTEVFSPDGGSLIFTAASTNGYATGRYFPPGKLGAHAFRYYIANNYFEDLFPSCIRTVLESLGLMGLVVPTGPNEDYCLSDQDIIATEGFATDVLGNIVGTMRIGNAQYKLAYLWPNGFDPIDLHSLASPGSGIDAQQATAVAGALVLGPYISWNGAQRTFSWSGGNGWLGDMGLSTNIVPNALNNNWRLVGHTTTGSQHPVTWYNNQMLTLFVPSGQSSGDATGLNRCGTIVGAAMDANFRMHALRWTKASCD